MRPRIPPDALTSHDPSDRAAMTVHQITTVSIYNPQITRVDAIPDNSLVAIVATLSNGDAVHGLVTLSFADFTQLEAFALKLIDQADHGLRT